MEQADGKVVDNHPRHGTESEAPRRALLMKTQTAIDRTRQPVAPRAIDRVLAKDCERGKTSRTRQFADRDEIERGQENSGIDRDQDRNRDEEAEQELERRAGIFQRLAGNLGVRPEETPYVSGQPESVNAER